MTSFPIVCVGGSAGGFEAFRELLKNLSDKPGMALVFIMHLAPGHKSMLTGLLARLTKMPVHEVESGMLLEVNHAYVIPPNADISTAGRKLILKKIKDDALRRMPIDCFFRSLAQEQGNRSIGVILSGTATDGTLGAEAIKAEGGIVFAQDEKSAKYSGMPNSAIAAGCVDFVLPPEKIAREIERIAQHPLVARDEFVKTDKSILLDTRKNKGLEGIFNIVRSTHGLDFTHYKIPTMTRRVSRRMVLLEFKKLNDYIKFLSGNEEEVGKLYEDLLINVTGFFRDPKAFDELQKRVVPAILKNKAKDQGVRIWVPGCSTGEEAYSIAICLVEAMGNRASAVPVQIFATDVSDSSLRKARQGIYGKNIKEGITPRRLKRFFTPIDHSYKISKQLREMCIFSKQNVFSDPPFSNIDLVSCRNLLIYLQPVLQKNAFHKFHYALRPGGFLFLGSSETVGGYPHLFNTLDRKKRIFIKKYLSVEPELELGQKYYLPKRSEINGKADGGKIKRTDVESMAERIALNEYAPCGVLIDGNMDVVQFRGHTGRYLESAAGAPSVNLFKLAREGLFIPLRSAIHKALKTKHTVRREAIGVKYQGRRARVHITVVPVEFGALKELFFLVLFGEPAGAVRSQNVPKAGGKSFKDERHAESLQKELLETKEYLQSVIEEQESANEEVKTANEEILSSNEELQSTNEELETAKEELQSSNEELVTTNEELQNRNAEVSLLNNDLINLLDGIHVPIIMLGTDLVIRRVTLQAEKALNVVLSDIGRPISKVKLTVDIPDLEKILRDVMKSLHPKRLEIKDAEGCWYSVLLRPYRTSDNRIDGAIAIFIDITERKKIEQRIQEARVYAEKIVETVREPLVILDADCRVISANKAFFRTFKVGPQETHGRLIYDLGNRQWNIPKLRQLLEEILLKNTPFENHEIEHDFETIGPKTMLLNGRRLYGGDQTTQMILLAIEDITERKRVEEHLRLIIEAAPNGMIMVGREGKIALVNSQTEKLFGYAREELLGQRIEMLVPERYRANHPGHRDSFFADPKVRSMGAGRDLFGLKKNGGEVPMEIGLSPIQTAEGLFTLASISDITDRKRAEEDIVTKNRELETILHVVSHDLKEPLRAIEGFADKVNEGYASRLDEKGREFLHRIMKASARMGRLLDDFLTLSRSKRIERSTGEVPGEVVAREALERLTAPIEKSKAKIEIAGDLPRLRANKIWATEGLYNLIGNALKFTHPGAAPEIEIAAYRPRDNEHREVGLVVRDRGPGVAPEHRERIFELFQRAVGHEVEGTGAGLAIVRSVAEQHGGHAWVRSREGGGSEFIITFGKAKP